MDWRGLEDQLQEFEREKWGTNDMREIQDAIQEEEWDAAQKRMTGMDEEQADWEADDPEVYSHDDAWGSEYE